MKLSNLPFFCGIGTWTMDSDKWITFDANALGPWIQTNGSPSMLMTHAFASVLASRLCIILCRTSKRKTGSRCALALQAVDPLDEEVAPFKCHKLLCFLHIKLIGH
jgi:hypothetical protein